jgi:hypothetical protein
MLGGYEPSVTFWGPLEAEYLGEQLEKLMPLAMMPTRQDGTAAGTDRLAIATPTDNIPIDDPAPDAGTVPATIPADEWQRTGQPTSAQPDAQIPRVAGIATFTWIGDDPSTQTPRVTLEFQDGSGNWNAVMRKSGRPVDDAELIVAYTPEPLQRGTGPQTHVWNVEWQAVPWLGAVGLDTLDDRGGVPLGMYRFHVVGHSWTLDSNPFQVVPGGLVTTAMRPDGVNLKATASWQAPKGWRLLDMNLPSNLPVPIRGQQVTVTYLGTGAATAPTATATTDTNGDFMVADNAAATSISVTDRFGNVGMVALPAEVSSRSLPVSSSSHGAAPAPSKL